jgi:hypothetical protein
MRLGLGILAVGTLAASSALAHHSFAMFDQTREVTVAGTVTEWQWTNPHSWLELDVPSKDGKSVAHWSLESGSPHTLTRLGWKSKMVKPGDKVVATINPMKDGSNGGALQSIVLADGRKIGGGGR